jgi:SAM-dependent methyltransferase
MPLIDHLLASSRTRQWLWKAWYPFVTLRLRDQGVLFLNYAFETGPPLRIPLSPADEADRPCIQLYHHVATQAALTGKEVLEVSCGHGGGASYLTRTLHPKSYVGLDLNPTGIEFCRERHGGLDQLKFVRGDAQQLPFNAEHFDTVINVEASHCYPAFNRFLEEVSRVLRPGGQFLYADFRFQSGIAEWEAAIAATPLQVVAMRDITHEVRRGLDLNSDRSERLIVEKLPSFLHSLGRDFAAVKGSRVYRAFQENALTYRSYLFEKR